MAYTCFKCKQLIPGPPKNLITHLRNVHAYTNGPGFQYICCQEGCQRTFHQVWSFIRHLSNVHPYNVNDVVPADNVDNDAGLDLPDHINDDVEMNDVPPPVPERNLDDDELKRLAMDFVCQLKQMNCLSLSAMNRIIQCSSQMFGDIITHLKATTMRTLNHLNVDMNHDEIVSLQSDFDRLSTPFAGLETDLTQKQFLEDSGMYIAPVSVPLGVKFVPTVDPKTGDLHQTQKTATAQYISVKSTLKLVVEQPGVIEMMMNYRTQNDGVLRDFHDGEYYRRHRLLNNEDVITIPLLLYFDECETVNPLGSKRTVHKCGFFYYTLKNIEPKLSCSNANCFLMAVSKTSDISEYGYAAVLAPAIADLKELETTGFHIDTDVFTGTVKAVVAQVTGDNLGLNSLFGFTESFRANYSCRICKVHRDDMISQVEDKPDLYRTREMYEADLAQHDVTLTGIKSPCALNDLSEFHVTSNFVVDIMHDLLEGVCSLEVKLILNGLIQSNVLTIDELNAQIKSFNYGFCDSHNKPTTNTITELSLRNPDGASGQSASQMWCLVRYLPLMIGHMVDENNEYWQLLIVLLKCMDIIFSPTVTLGEKFYLKELIRDHHNYFLALFPHRHLKPKHHFMVHYPMVIRKIGPLVHFWTMRFEGKHNFFKRIAHVTCNFKNIPKTMALRHQTDLSCRLYAHSVLKPKVLEIGTGSSHILATLDNAELIATSFANMPLYGELYLANWIEMQGTNYRPGMTLIIGRSDNDLFLFGLIVNILVDDNQDAKFYLRRWKTIGFDEHFHAYEVEEGPDVSILNCDDLLDSIYF
ncbi:uncharacterized protein LOC106175700 [Lingula anatina]|uniref:Uncharacterized protein LOC106175700 n=1 Tax=Lingula anatina TaxID=7574 RepID=A0A1S3JSG4_LINAN|nr:uncharacterized protein LOC106175700 [Lingula anatina]XP_013413277.1 uncharacterized protein LOC106175700 [Lingula anatina]|eukprot:XP_013413276.1 uncharacterized protein LOC106175700 [Lingula anatina]